MGEVEARVTGRDLVHWRAYFAEVDEDADERLALMMGGKPKKKR